MVKKPLLLLMLALLLSQGVRADDDDEFEDIEDIAVSKAVVLKDFNKDLESSPFP